MPVCFHTPPENQGQIVTVSYGWVDGALLRRSFDAAGRKVVTRRIVDPWDGLTKAQKTRLQSWDPWNSEPPTFLDFEEVVYEGPASREPEYGDEV